MAETIVIGDGPPQPLQVEAVARHGARAELSAAAVERMLASRAHVVRAAAAGPDDPPVYGITTGFGALATTRITPEARVALQHALVRSHAAGMGPPIGRDVVRAMMLLRARTLAMGYSGVRPAVASGLLDLLNADVTPYVPCYGSLGASGDLAPLAHAALCLTGEGWVLGEDGRPREAAAALQSAGLRPLAFEAKEGVALLNGTDGMLGMLVLACLDAARLFRTADVACAMCVEALLGTDRPFRSDLHALRPQPGQARSAANLSRLLDRSEIVRSHQGSDHLVQDAYSLRCHPQVVGACRDTLDFANGVASRELGSAVDNPVVMPDGRVESTGNFHGEPLAFACDFLTIAAAEVGSIAERRIDRLMDPARSQGLPPFLTPNAGVNSGLMIAHYTAAAVVAENRRLAVPASVDSLPTSAMQEDHVSMGWNAAMKLRQALENLSRILAVEVLAASYGLCLREPLRPAPASSAVADLIFRTVPRPGDDRFLAPHLAEVEQLVASGRILATAEDVVGSLR
jgi:histidine ammonia-lyase